MKCATNLLLAFPLFLAQVSSAQADHARIQRRLPSHKAAANEGRSLVVGGADAPPDRFPYYSILDVETSAGFFFCGAVLVHDDMLLTTAKCVEGALSIFTAVNYTVDTSQPTGFEYYRAIIASRAHAQFDSTTNDYDIALLKMELPVFQVAPVTIGTTRPKNGDSVTAVGFGQLAEGSDFPALLQEVEVEIIPFQMCNSESSYNGKIKNRRMICAAAPGKDTCDGDAGGPLVVKGQTESDDLLVGLTSFGNGCARPNFPGVYTRLQNLQEWIDDGICELSSFRPSTCPSLAPSTTPTVTAAPTSPTSSPAPSDSPAPSPSPTRRPFVDCFSGETIVKTEGGKFTRMDELRIGDKVLVDGDNQYETVYGFGHRNKNIKADYLKINTSANTKPLVISTAHLLFIDGGLAVPASSLSVGDQVVLDNNGLGTVTSINTVKSDGIYAPFTMSGTIVVNGIKASNFVALQEDMWQLHLGGIPTPISFHWMAFVFEASHRLGYRAGLLRTETYSEEGISHRVYHAWKGANWVLCQNGFVMGLITIPLVGLLTVVYFLEQYGLGAALAFGIVLGMVHVSKSLKVVKVKTA